MKNQLTEQKNILNNEIQQLRLTNAKANNLNTSLKQIEVKKNI